MTDEASIRNVILPNIMVARIISIYGWFIVYNVCQSLELNVDELSVKVDRFRRA